jgi:hypothetical protein
MFRHIAEQVGENYSSTFEEVERKVIHYDRLDFYQMLNDGYLRQNSMQKIAIAQKIKELVRSKPRSDGPSNKIFKYLLGFEGLKGKVIITISEMFSPILENENFIKEVIETKRYIFTISFLKEMIKKYPDFVLQVIEEKRVELKEEDLLKDTGTPDAREKDDFEFLKELIDRDYLTIFMKIVLLLKYNRMSPYFIKLVKYIIQGSNLKFEFVDFLLDEYTILLFTYRLVEEIVISFCKKVPYNDKLVSIFKKICSKNNTWEQIIYSESLKEDNPKLIKTILETGIFKRQIILIKCIHNLNLDSIKECFENEDFKKISLEEVFEFPFHENESEKFYEVIKFLLENECYVSHQFFYKICKYGVELFRIIMVHLDIEMLDNSILYKCIYESNLYLFTCLLDENLVTNGYEMGLFIALLMNNKIYHFVYQDWFERYFTFGYRLQIEGIKTICERYRNELYVIAQNELEKCVTKDVLDNILLEYL